MRILYVQYTNPGGYPPLHHSSGILADKGWKVRFLGIRAPEVTNLDLPGHPNISSREWTSLAPGIRQKLHFLLFNVWIVWTALRWRPHWVYASDFAAAPSALFLRGIGFRVVYHEHDTPMRRRSRFDQWLQRARSTLARSADICVLPNETRLANFTRLTGRTRKTFCVWNCPRRGEALVDPPKPAAPVLYYHGNIGADLLPLTLMEALARVPEMHLRVIGYTTTGNEAYPSKLRAQAAQFGVADRFVLLGPMPRRALLEQARRCTIGWAAMPVASANPNFQAMTGASNKVFDYMACGMALLVSNAPAWRGMYVQPGYGLTCDADDPGSIADALRWFVQHHDRTAEIGEFARAKILEAWNYEAQFAPVLQVMQVMANG